ncbi:MAG: AsmA family protein, partial [Desulfocapsaceae bacterium]|nr:AsmA family protein [Desulfocapsaceae bacterium]
MGKVIKYLFITLAGISLLLGAAVLIAPYLLNVEQFKPKIEQIVSEQSGYPLTINGDIDLSIFPWAGLSLTDLKLDNPEGFQENTFLTVKNVQVRIKVLPLLKKNVEIHRFIIDKPEILLSRDGS